MKTNFQTKAVFSGAIISGAILLAAVTAPADTYFQSVNEANSGDWTQAIVNSVTPTPVAATSGNDYISGIVNGTNFAVRTINTSTLSPEFCRRPSDYSNGCALILNMPVRIAGQPDIETEGRLSSMEVGARQPLWCWGERYR